MEKSLGSKNIGTEYFSELGDHWLKLLVDLVVCICLESFKFSLKGLLDLLKRIFTRPLGCLGELLYAYKLQMHFSGLEDYTGLG